MPSSIFRFAKIDATPTKVSWAQVYHAGSVFAIVSLAQTAEEDAVSLQTIGKDIINSLEVEFFGLAEKNLATIQAAILSTCKDVPESVDLGIVLAHCKDSVLYVFVLRDGQISIKRKATFSTILSREANGHEAPGEETLVSASGYLEKDDVVVLQTRQFSDVITEHELLASLQSDDPSEVADALNPHVHGIEQGGAAAVILSYLGLPHNEPEDLLTDDTDDEEKQPTQEHVPSGTQNETLIKKPADEAEEKTPSSFLSSALSRIQRIVSRIPFQVSHKRKVFLSISLLIGIVLIVSIVLTIRNQQTVRQRSEFNKVYEAAKKEYDEGLSLVSLNKPLARDDFHAAKKIILAGQAQFAKDSKEYKDLATFLQDVEKELADTEESYAVEAKKVDLSEAKLLQAISVSKAIAAATYDDATISLLKDGIYHTDSDGKKQKKIITNDEDWKNAIDLDTFGSNIYLLDRNGGLLKFVAGANGFGKNDYFSGKSAPEMKKAVAMAIDGSIYIAFSDGNIAKFTKGTQDSFAVSGLDIPLKTITAITTRPESDFLYVLDQGNSRIVVIKKDGAYQKQLKSTVLQSATALQLDEGEKALFVLASNDVYTLNLK